MICNVTKHTKIIKLKSFAFIRELLLKLLQLVHSCCGKRLVLKVKEIETVPFVLFRSFFFFFFTALITTTTLEILA